MDHAPSFALESYWGAPWKVEFRSETPNPEEEAITQFVIDECGFDKAKAEEMIHLLKNDAMIQCGCADEATAETLAGKFRSVGLLAEHSKGMG